MQGALAVTMLYTESHRRKRPHKNAGAFSWRIWQSHGGNNITFRYGKRYITIMRCRYEKCPSCGTRGTQIAAAIFYVTTGIMPKGV